MDEKCHECGGMLDFNSGMILDESFFNKYYKTLWVCLDCGIALLEEIFPDVRKPHSKERSDT